MPPHPGEEPSDDVAPPPRGTPEHEARDAPRAAHRGASSRYRMAVDASRKHVVAEALDELLAMTGTVHTPEQRIALMTGVDYLDGFRGGMFGGLFGSPFGF